CDTNDSLSVADPPRRTSVGRNCRVFSDAGIRHVVALNSVDSPLPEEVAAARRAVDLRAADLLPGPFPAARARGGEQWVPGQILAPKADRPADKAARWA